MSAPLTHDAVYEVALRRGPGMTEQCLHGEHDACRGMVGFHRCPCSCHHVRTVAGTCAMYGCDCHEQNGKHGLPFQKRHRTSCRIWFLREVKRP